MSTPERKSTAESAVAKLLNDSSGLELEELDHRASFLELGFDSLFLVQFSQKIKSKLKVRITFRQLMEETTNLSLLVDYLAEKLPEELVTTPEHENEVKPHVYVPEPSPMASAKPDVVGRSDASSAAEMVRNGSSIPSHVPNNSSAPESRAATPLTASLRPPAIRSGGSREELIEIISQQNQLMSLQLQLLGGSNTNLPTHTAAPVKFDSETDSGDSVTAMPLSQTSQMESENVGAPASGPRDSAPVGPVRETPKFERFGPYKPVRRAPDGGLTEKQQKYLNDLVERFTRRTSKSRVHAQTHRKHFADPRGVAGYRRFWKSMVYQIAVERSKGSKLWDIDGNEYIDIAMGFGLNLFGQSPDFVTNAIRKQLDLGIEVGPQSPLAGEVAQLLCDFARKDRVTFCNTGSEAVMAAMRLARTVTGKTKVVFFNKDYHGNFDQVLVRSTRISGKQVSSPAAPGVPRSNAEDMIVLEYGSPDSLEVIRERADEIAAVLVEPVQSADPFLKPHEFLREVRRITSDNDMAMIMDEVITGFRAAPGGAQEWFDVWGDMSTYGKVLGGGLPIGALAGSAKYMDALDGGNWNFDDDSEPEADMTFFAGTFVRHPLAMAAAHQVLMKVKDSGPELQSRLTEKTSHLVNSLNEFFEKELFPIRVAQFTSLFRFMFPPTVEFSDLLYFHLLDRGIFTRGWGDNCFLSTAHSAEDVERIIDAVKESCLEIRAGDFMPKPDLLGDGRESGFPKSATSDLARKGDSQARGIGAVATSITDKTVQLSTIEEIREEGALPPLFCMPAADGLTLVFHELADRLGNDLPVYGLNSPGAYGETVPETIEEMAQRFIHDMRDVQPHGPYLLIGYCSGGSIAFEAAQQLTAAGEKVAFVAGIETYDWGTAQSSNPNLWIKTCYQIQRFEFHLRNFLMLDRANKRAFLRSKYDRLKSRIAIWRGMITGIFSSAKKHSASSGSVNWNELWKQHDAQADRYVPKPYPGKLLLIRPKKDYRSYVGREDLVATEGVEVVRIPAYPAGLMTPPFVDQVADVVRRGIEQGLRECDVPFTPIRSAIVASDSCEAQAVIATRTPEAAPQ